MTEEQLVELGVRAEALLQSKTFRFVVDHLGQQYAAAVLQSDPKDSQTREENYYKHRALQDIVAQLSGYVATRDAIANKESE